MAQAIDRRRINDIDAALDHITDRLDRFIIVDLTPAGSADAPGSQSDRRDLNSQFFYFVVVHFVFSFLYFKLLDFILYS